MNKRGSHVGIVLSFVIFIVFIVFLYAIMQPAIRIGEDKQLSLTSLEPDFLDYISEELVILTVFNDTAHPSFDCLGIDEGVSGISGLNCRVKNESGKNVNATSSGGILEINWKDEKFFKIHCSSEEFENTLFSSLTGCVFGNLKSTTKKNYIFQTKIHSLKIEYDNNYELLKRNLGVSKNDDFGFNFEYNNGTQIGTIEEGISRSIYSENIPIFYIDEDANIKKGYIDIKIW